MRKGFHDAEVVRLRGSPIQVLDRAILVLEAVATQGASTLSAVRHEVKLPLSTVSRILDSLVAHDLVERDRHSRTYALGSRILTLSSRVRQRRDLLQVARPVLEELAIESEEDVGLSTLQGTHAVIVDRVEGPKPLKIIDVLGEAVPLYCGAFRKVLLAYQPADWTEKYISSTPLIQFTRGTIKNKSALRHELQTIRDKGYALSRGEKIADAAGVAAPIFGPRRKVQAAVFVAGPITRYNDESFPRLIKAVVAAATRLTALVGDREPAATERGRLPRVARA